MTLQIAPNNSSHTLTHTNTLHVHAKYWGDPVSDGLSLVRATPLSNCLYRFHIPLVHNGRDREKNIVSSLSGHPQKCHSEKRNLSRWHVLYDFSELDFYLLDQLYTQSIENVQVSVKIHTERHTIPIKRKEYLTRLRWDCIEMLYFGRWIYVSLCAIEIKTKAKSVNRMTNGMEWYLEWFMWSKVVGIYFSSAPSWSNIINIRNRRRITENSNDGHANRALSNREKNPIEYVSLWIND